MTTKKIMGYKILLDKQLGVGSFGKVCAAQKQSNGKLCAMKIIQKKKISKQQYLMNALLSEIKIMSKLSSVNIVEFMGVLESSNNVYIAQQLCDSDLEKELKIHKKFTEQKAKNFLLQICNGFLQLVQQGIVHRDLKPSNILIKKGTVKICDFGFAKCNSHKQVKNESNVGTPLYKSLQIFKGIPYTSKCDIWAMGLIFYEMLHGKTPYDLTKLKCQTELIKQIEQHNFLIDQDLSDATKDFLNKTLQIYQKDRICWDKVYRHEIFQGCFDKQIKKNKLLQNKYKKVMGDLRFRINCQNIDIKNLWKELGFDSKKQLNITQFQDLLNKINPDLQKNEQNYFIEKIDVKGNGMVSLSEFQAELKKQCEPLKEITIQKNNDSKRI